ncbi:MAG: hypothetical protein RLZZ398_209 [Verrucomicrobiota bacterium]|jgi:hypothetical protein
MEAIVLSLIEKLSPDYAAVEEWVEQVRSANPELDAGALADYVGDKIVWIYTSQGAALALPGAIPGLGTVVQIGVESGATMTDIALMVRNQSYLVFALSACMGRKGKDTLIQDTLICMGLWTNALQLTKTGAIPIGTKIAEANFKKRIPASILMAVNKRVSTTVLTKYGTKRGGVALDRLIPFGVGVAVGGGFNYLTMKAFKKATIRYLTMKAP